MPSAVWCSPRGSSAVFPHVYLETGFAFAFWNEGKGNRVLSARLLIESNYVHLPLV